MKIGGYIQFLMTLFIAWLFYQTYTSSEYSLFNSDNVNLPTLYRINEATGQTDVFDAEVNGWVRILHTGYVRDVQELPSDPEEPPEEAN